MLLSSFLTVDQRQHLNVSKLCVLRHRHPPLSISQIHLHILLWKMRREKIHKHTCLSNSSLLALRQVTRYLVRLRNEPSTSMVRWSLEERCSMKLITRKPRFWIMCCCTVCEVSTSSQMNPRSFELQRKKNYLIIIHYSCLPSEWKKY